MRKIQKWGTVSIIVIAIILAPVIIGQLTRLPYGHLTIGDENSWVSFFGSYTGGILGGLVAFGVAWLQINNLRKETLENNRSYLSAATPVRVFFSEEKINRREKHRIIVTDDSSSMNALYKRIPYYSIVRFGSSQVIWECEFEITLGKDENFTCTDTFKVWIDFFEKDEEILIPLCSAKLQTPIPYIKEITVTYRTEKNELMKFYQSEEKKVRKHYIVGKKDKLIKEFDVHYSTWIER